MKNKYLLLVLAGVFSVSSGHANNTNGVETTASVNQGANQTANQNRRASGQQYLMGGVMMTMAAAQAAKCGSMCGTCCAMAAMYGAMGVMSFQQGKEHNNVANGADLTSWGSDGYGNPYPTPNGNGPSLIDPDGALGKEPVITGYDKNLDKLKAAGIYDPTTQQFGLPDGKKLSLKDVASQQALSDAVGGAAAGGAWGMYEAAAKKALEKVDKLKIGAMTETAGFDEGGGGGGGGMNFDSGSGEAETVIIGGAGGAGALGKERDPASMAGMQKNYNGDPIGVAADSIFLMMNRRYKVKESQESFFTDTELSMRR